MPSVETVEAKRTVARNVRLIAGDAGDIVCAAKVVEEDSWSEGNAIVPELSPHGYFVSKNSVRAKFKYHG
jgi:hypothetical protein